MTTRELRNEVSALCHTDIAEKDLCFIAYANLALRMIFNEICIVGSHTIRPCPKPLSYTESIRSEGDSFTLPLRGNSYSLIARGKGRITVTDSNGVLIKNIEGEETAVRGFLSGEANLTVSEGSRLTLLHLSCFEDDFSGLEESIPLLTPTVSYSMRSAVTDFHSFLHAPTDEGGAPLQDVRLIDDRVIFKRDLCKEINLLYKRVPRRISADVPDCEIDLPEELSELISLLCSSLMLAEDEPNLSEHYGKLYTDGVRLGKVGRFKSVGTSYINESGWA